MRCSYLPFFCDASMNQCISYKCKFYIPKYGNGACFFHVFCFAANIYIGLNKVNGKHPKALWIGSKPAIPAMIADLFCGSTCHSVIYIEPHDFACSKWCVLEIYCWILSNGWKDVGHSKEGSLSVVPTWNSTVFLHHLLNFSWKSPVCSVLLGFVTPLFHKNWTSPST